MILIHLSTPQRCWRQRSDNKGHHGAMKAPTDRGGPNGGAYSTQHFLRRVGLTSPGNETLCFYLMIYFAEIFQTIGKKNNLNIEEVARRKVRLGRLHGTADQATVLYSTWAG